MNEKERSQAKLKRVLEQKGYTEGKLPQGKVAHHVKPVAEGGKTTKSNIRVISEAKHVQIHSNRNKRGKI
jgi:hypothetical protein